LFLILFSIEIAFGGVYGIGTYPGEVNVLLICVTITIEDKGTNSMRVIDLLRNEDEVFNKM
jgi:hypothetical protein